MAASTSFFLEKLRPETRLQIYSYVFGPSHIKPSSNDTALGMRRDPTDSIAFSTPPPEPDICLDTSILLSNKFVFVEALPVLYGEKTVRGTTEDFDELLRNPDFVERVRHIEIADCVGSYQDNQFHAILRRLQVLPKVRSLVILSDCLGHVDKQLAGATAFLTVPQFCGLAQLGEVTCLDIGCYQLHGMFGNFQFVNRRLRQMFPSVGSSPDDYDVYQDVASVFDGRPSFDNSANSSHNAIAWALQTCLRRWVGFHDLLISMALSGELDRLRGSQVPSQAAKFRTLKAYSRTTRPYGSFNAGHLIDGTSEMSGLGRWRLRDLNADDDPELLSWATEYLSVNVHTYCAPLPDRSQRRVLTRRNSHWAETDGSLSTIEYQFRQKESAQTGVTNSSWICHPYHSGNAFSRESASRFVGNYFISLKGILKGKWCRNFPKLSGIELTQVTYLCMAIRGGHTLPASEDPEEHDRWSANLLQRYILASGSLSQTDVLHAPVDDLRKVVQKIVTALSSPEEKEKYHLTEASLMVRTQPPEDFDSDHFQPFAWLYGPLLERAWREYVATAGSSSMDLS